MDGLKQTNCNIRSLLVFGMLVEFMCLQLVAVAPICQAVCERACACV